MFDWLKYPKSVNYVRLKRLEHICHVCKICGIESEIIDHVLFRCLKAQLVWKNHFID